MTFGPTDGAVSRPIAIVGPTAVGKTRIGIGAALALDGEIINADSMQVYRGMDVGTAKPTDCEREQVNFHLIDVVDPDMPWTVSDFQIAAKSASDAVTRTGRLPIFVGGTGLYIRSVTTDMQIPDSQRNPEVRAKWNEYADANGNEALHRLAAECDPDAAAKIHVNDRYRVIRLLEVAELTGETLSSWHRRNVETAVATSPIIVALNYADRRRLYSAIEHRVDVMIESGFEAEVAGLLKLGYTDDLPSFKSLGYRQMASVVRGELSLHEAVDLIKRQSRKYARRQLIWFRADRNVVWVEVDDKSDTEIIGEVVQHIKVNIGTGRIEKPANE